MNDGAGERAEDARSEQARSEKARSEKARADEVRAAETLARLQAGVRQRQAALATTETGRRLPAPLARLTEARYLQEPVISSHRPLIGPLIVFVKKVGYHLFAKDHVRAVIRQQSDFNRSVVQVLQDLYDRQRPAGPAEGATDEDGSPSGVR